MTQLCRALHEAIALFRHRLGIFLPHCAPQQVGLAEAIARKHVRNPHDLFLVDDDAQRVLEDSFKRRQQILHLFAPPLPLDEIVDHIHRAGAVQRIQLRSIPRPYPACSAAECRASPKIQIETLPK